MVCVFSTYWGNKTNNYSYKCNMYLLFLKTYFLALFVWEPPDGMPSWAWDLLVVWVRSWPRWTRTLARWPACGWRSSGALGRKKRRGWEGKTTFVAVFHRFLFNENHWNNKNCHQMQQVVFLRFFWDWFWWQWLAESIAVIVGLKLKAAETFEASCNHIGGLYGCFLYRRVGWHHQTLGPAFHEGDDEDERFYWRLWWLGFLNSEFCGLIFFVWVFILYT